jgi:DNA polymerase-3 subunit chi
VDFHTGVAEPVAFACRLLRKAYHQGARVSVRAPVATLAVLDRALWVFEAQAFVPHLRVGPAAPDAAALRRTPIWLVEGAAPEPAPTVLVTVDAEPQESDGRCTRLIEIVSTDAVAMQAARRRWRIYEARGWPIRHHPAGSPDKPGVRAAGNPRSP